MRSLNRLQIIGYAGADAELRTTTGGSQVATFSVATTHGWVAEGTRHERTTWHRCSAWNDQRPNGRQLATQAEQLVRKGTPVMVEGRIETRAWIDKDGVEHQSYELVVAQFIVLASRRGGDDE